MNLIETINQTIIQHIKKIFPNLEKQTLDSIDITLNTDLQKPEFGDITTNAALILAKELKQKPRDIALKIVENLKYEYIEWVDIAGSGFINCFLTKEAIAVLARELCLGNEDFFKLEASEPKKSYSLEFVSANPTGPLHLGHGRGGIIGDVLGNILRFLGHTVTKEYYINDAGAQMEKLGMSLKIRCEQLLGMATELPEDAYHGEYLIEMAKECIDEYKKSVLEKDIEFLSHYAEKRILEQIKKTLTDYAIHYDLWFSEKTLHQSGAINKALHLLRDKGFIYEQDGALWFKSTQFGDDKDRVVRKSNGEITYVAADIAYLINKFGRAQHLIMVLGQDHHSYEVRLKGITQALGHNPQNLDIILYQLVTLKESGQAVRMSKRSGTMVTLDDIIKTVGTDVARFFYLNRKAEAHLDFDIDLALKHTEENPVYYIQYAYVRTVSILEKAQQFKELTNITCDDARFMNETEKMVLKKIISLKSLLKNISVNYHTHLLTYYTLELAHYFHNYYSVNRVIAPDNVEQSRGRLLLIQLIQNTLALCNKILGIHSPQKM